MRFVRLMGALVAFGVGVTLMHCGGQDQGGLFVNDDGGSSGDDAQSDAPLDVVDVADAEAGDVQTVPPNRCPSAHGQKMAELPTKDGQTFCIDTTEVTNAQFAAFVAQTNGHYPAPHCLDDQGGVPGGDCKYDPVARADYPVVCMTWCNAYAYCAWAGKRLCGKIGGGANSPEEFDNAALSQWYAACSTNGTNAVPYGNDEDARCNVYGHLDGGVSVEPVGAAKDCHASTEPFSSLLDMTGNVAEWEDSCEDGGACLYRGGNYSDNLKAVCGKWGYPNRDQPSPRMDRLSANAMTGFRCCAD